MSRTVMIVTIQSINQMGESAEVARSEQLIYNFIITDSNEAKATNIKSKVSLYTPSTLCAKPLSTHSL